MPDYDVIVLGGGSAGTSAAKAAAARGARTLMINDGELGGLCILRGCMPTKAMLASAHAAHEARHTSSFGVRVEGRVVPDFTAIMDRKALQVERFKRAKIRAIERSDYEVLDARARFVSGGAVEAGGRTYRATSGYVVATGSYPYCMDLPGIGAARVLTSDDVMELREAPRSLVVQGAGPIGLELAQFFARIGTEVTLVNRSPLLARYDSEAGDELRRALDAEDGIELLVPGRIDAIRRDGDASVFEVCADDERRTVRAEALLMAVGRRAALDELGLEHVGLIPEDGRLGYDRAMRTANPRVFVAGDATDTFQILHIANQEGTVAGYNAAGADPPIEVDYRLKMTEIFTDPPYAQLGLTEMEAMHTGREIVVGRARFPETGRAITMGAAFGVWKLLADARTGEILGSSILGPRADDLVHSVAAMMAYRGTADHVLELPWYHPTLSEVVLEVARDVVRRLPADRPREPPGR